MPLWIATLATMVCVGIQELNHRLSEYLRMIAEFGFDVVPAA